MGEANCEKSAYKQKVESLYVQKTTLGTGGFLVLTIFTGVCIIRN
jgi:hypothetical protein